MEIMLSIDIFLLLLFFRILICFTWIIDHLNMLQVSVYNKIKVLFMFDKELPFTS